MTDEMEVTIRADAFSRACREVLCAGGAIYTSASTPAALLEEIRLSFTDELRLLSPDDVQEMTSSDTGRFTDGGTMITVSGVQLTERIDVVSVKVRITKGALDWIDKPFLYAWNGSLWQPTEGNTVGITVTTAVP
jgi:hypothetical protein